MKTKLMRKLLRRDRMFLPDNPMPQPKLDESQGSVLRFTPTAWAKLQYFCHRGPTEIGGFGVSAADDLLLIEEFVTVRQTVSMAHVAFDDTAVADFFEDQVDLGRRPEHFGRLWLHTHPGDSPHPSLTDEQTFARVFGGCDWAVMFVLARGGSTYARLRFNIGPKGELLVPVRIDYSRPFAASDQDAWEQEYQLNIQPEIVEVTQDPRSRPDKRQDLSRQEQNRLEEDLWNWGLGREEELDLMPDAHEGGEFI